MTLLMSTLAWAAPESVQSMIDIKAARMEISQKDGMVKFEGEVVVKQNDLELRCERLKARYDKSGQLIELQAYGQIEVVSPRWTAQADRALYFRKRDVLELRGQPRVHRDDHWLEGKSITVHLSEQRLIVEHARGQFNGASLPDRALR